MVGISKADIKTQIHINLQFAKHNGGPLGVAAVKLAQLWLTQLTPQERKGIEDVEALDLTGF